MSERRQRSHHALLVFLLVLVPILFLLGWSQASLNLSFIHPQDAAETILLDVLSAVIVVAFIIFLLILARILVKLYFERRQNQLGSRFKTRMVVAFLGLSLVPVCFLVLFSYGLINRSIDKWFGIPFDTLRKDASALTAQLTQQSQQATLNDAGRLAAVPGMPAELETGNTSELTRMLERKVEELGLESALCLDTRGRLLARAGESYPALHDLPRLFPRVAWDRLPLGGITARGGKGQSGTFLAAFPVLGASGVRLGTVLAARRLPLNVQHMANQISNEAHRYDALGRQNRRLKQAYLLILFLLTVIILFVATWAAMFFAKQVTVPIQALAEATHEVSKGNLGWQISARADAELGSLIRMFNEMTIQLEENRRAIEKGNGELQQAYRELGERTSTMGAILENVPTGVISFNPLGEITQMNPMALQMFGRKGLEGARNLGDLFPADDAREISRLFRRAKRQGVVNRQLTLGLGERRALMGLTLSSVSAQHGAIGFVMVLEDLTDVVQAQRSAAWREVAQRVAHEIKNPLTPIQLSSERIRRLIAKSPADGAQPALLAAVGESASLITREVSTLKKLVDEFSRFARFPASQPVPSSLNRIVETALEVFDGRLANIVIHRDLAGDIPTVRADPEQMKRVVVNLIDNAAEALEAAPVKEIWVRTRADLERELVYAVVADSGPGISPEAKERLFLPFYSTKQRGTGLGLAIVSRIVSEHHGAIRVEKNWPSGTQFVIEIPAEPSASMN